MMKYTKEELESMKRTDLQKLCKKVGIKANIKTEKMVEELAKHCNTTNLENQGKEAVINEPTSTIKEVNNDRVIVSGQRDASPALSAEVDNSNPDAATVGGSSGPSIGVNVGNVEVCLSEMGEVSVAVSERPCNCREGMDLVNCPLVDQSPLSYEYLMYGTSCGTGTFVLNTPKTPIITNSNYMEKACQTTIAEFSYCLNSQKTYVHHCICQQGCTAIENIKSKISDLQSSVDSFETFLTRYYFRITKPQI